MEFLQDYGLLGLFAGSFLASTVVPFSSDLLLVGVLVAGIDPWSSFFVATAGNWLGSLTSYWLGRLGKWEWIEKMFGVTKERLETQKEKVDRYGSLLALLSWLPFIGDVFSIALGFYRTDFIKTSLFMLAGKALRFAVWVLLFLEFGERILYF